MCFTAIQNGDTKEYMTFQGGFSGFKWVPGCFKWALRGVSRSYRTFQGGFRCVLKGF